MQHRRSEEIHHFIGERVYEFNRAQLFAEYQRLEVRNIDIRRARRKFELQMPGAVVVYLQRDNTVVVHLTCLLWAMIRGLTHRLRRMAGPNP